MTRSQTERYLSLLFPGHAFPADFAEELYHRTEGSPLFIADLLSYLRERGAISNVDGCWITRRLSDVRGELPESVRSMIQRKLEQLGDVDRRLLTAAAVQGTEFDSAVVAQALEIPAAEVEEQLQALQRVHNLVRLLREHEFSGRTISLRYAFVHVLYQQALYNELTPSRRAELAAELARSFERFVGDRESAAPELACLYEVGREYGAAARYYWRATQNAASVFAHHEAIALAKRGLKLLEFVAKDERVEFEIRMQTALGLQLQITKGYAAPQAQQAYTRARELCLKSPELALEFPVLWGLWLCRKVRSELVEAQEVADALLDLARQLNEPALAMQAHQALAMTALCRGIQPATLRNVEQVASLYDPDRHRAHSAKFGQDPGVICKAFGAVALWLLGYPDTAAQQSAQAIEMSGGQSPTTEAVAVYFASVVHQMRGDRAQAQDCAERTVAISSQHGLSFWLAGGRILEAWTQAQGDSATGAVLQLRQGLADWRSIGSVTYETYFLGLLAEMLLGSGQFDDARGTIDEALALAERTGERFYQAELYRLRGTLVLGRGSEPTFECCQSAEGDFRRALEIATEQEAKSLALRAAISLVQLSQRLGRRDEALSQLARWYGAFTEGHSTADLQNAATLLRALQ
jgi:adenylate cyclase